VRPRPTKLVLVSELVLESSTDIAKPQLLKKDEYLSKTLVREATN
jgi:hypothetical protein